MKTNAGGLDGRSFLSRSTTLPGGVPLLSSNSASAVQIGGGSTPGPVLHLYCDEGGIISNDVAFMLGMPVTTHSARRESAIGCKRETHLRTHGAGLWIDHRKAIVVPVTNMGEETKQITSNVEKDRRRSGDSLLEGRYDSQQVPPMALCRVIPHERGPDHGVLSI
jgi:hypothetical protein